MPQDFGGSLALNGSSVRISLSTCQNESPTFSGAANGVVTIHAMGSNFGGGTVTVTLFDAKFPFGPYNRLPVPRSRYQSRSV